jgi:hypothetical protein
MDRIDARVLLLVAHGEPGGFPDCGGMVRFADGAGPDLLPVALVEDEDFAVEGAETATVLLRHA